MLSAFVPGKVGKLGFYRLHSRLQPSQYIDAEKEGAALHFTSLDGCKTAQRNTVVSTDRTDKLVYRVYIPYIPYGPYIPYTPYIPYIHYLPYTPYIPYIPSSFFSFSLYYLYMFPTYPTPRRDAAFSCDSRYI